MNIKRFIFLVASVLIMGSCAKEGPQGIPGPQGDQGLAGAAGPAGDDGSVIYSGNGAPATSLGKNGDYYLDKASGNLYGPKTDNGWGTPLPLKTGQGTTGPQGAQGPQGNPGSQILSGSGAPAASLGNNGDFYLDKTGYFLYGPKTANGWGTPVLLRGAQGPQGPAGPAGIPGSQIYSGTGAPAANLGAIGDYYLDKSNGNFYGPKTANGWGSPISLTGSGSQGATGPQGPQGPQGTPGSPGSQGPQGPQGPSGPAGPQGPTGPAGPSGPTGPQGPQGPAGSQGTPGAAGAAGSQIFSGSGAPSSTIGKTGDYYIDTIQAVLYGPRTASGWNSSGLALQVNNSISYVFNNKPSFGLPYSWKLVTQQVQGITLPYDNAAAQTQGFTIPQDIVDNGIVLSYIRYFTSFVSDTATSAGLTPWYQMPYSVSIVGQNTLLSTFNISTTVGIGSFQVLVGCSTNSAVNFTNLNTPATIRIVLIPAGKINALESINPDPSRISWNDLSKMLNADTEKIQVTNGTL